MSDWDADDNHGPSESGRYCLCGRFWPCRTLTLIADLAAAREREQRLVDALRDQITWFQSEDGPLFQAWEDGRIGNFDDHDMTWEETLAGAADVERFPQPDDLRTGIGATHVARYRRLLAAAAPAAEAQEPRGEGGDESARGFLPELRRNDLSALRGIGDEDGPGRPRRLRRLSTPSEAYSAGTPRAYREGSRPAATSRPGERR